jgi:hypothetical protein
MISFLTRGKRTPLVALGLLLSLALLSACHKAAPHAPAAKLAIAMAVAKTNSTSAAGTNVSDEFVSVFNDQLPRVDTKDPFYPDSAREITINQTALTQNQAPKQVVLKLFSIAGSVKKRLAVINNEILAVGEESDVKTTDGKVHVKVIEIGQDYVVAAVQGEASPKRLTLINKK